MTWEQWLDEQATAREAAGLTRRLQPRAADDPTIDLAGNDYLGLAGDPTVRQAAADAALTWGGGAGASRLVTGTLDLHDQLEHELADYLGQPSALVLSSGYAANLAVVTALADRSTHVISDAHIHASLVDAARLSRARLTVVPHSDVAAVRDALEVSTGSTASAGERALVLAESVYSVLGDAAPLADLADLCASYDALLVVDEAHGLGVHGPGVVARSGLAGHPHVVVTATLSKSLGSQGGAVLGPPALREHLVNRARPFIFDTALAPASTAAALAALGVLRARPELSDLVRKRVRTLADALGVVTPDGAVLSIPMPSPQAAVTAQAAALADGVRVGCFRPPSVPDGISRLRATASAGIASADWDHAVAVLVTVAKEHQ
ncbi:8-amino-7-oxononanoate synthase [Nocardioides sp. HM23]|uniref:8-amino-7-oxononanoate synthase n=1 Tax=Nocardioides bizhenqiangii TaxID=3095076 RepID=UPI002ACA2358|nr:8-amino-7-oxononanoate synthase [Nocardioides sp. HM23]MDZ5623010.1 8-amino-7-oxononanoate synthase [Nocardioides sp. HM23]